MQSTQQVSGYSKYCPKKRIKSDTRDKCNTDTQQTQTNTNTMEHNQAEQIND